MYTGTDPLIISVAPNGARRTKRDHPALPITVGEIARDALACAKAGALAIHLHVRDASGTHTLAADTYRAAIEAIREAAGDRLVVQVSTEAVGRYTRREQVALVRDLRPEAISIAVRELMPDRAAEADAARFLAWAAASRIGVQHIVYSPEEGSRLVDLVERGVVPTGVSRVASGFSRKSPHALIVLGRYATRQRAEPADLNPFLDRWPPQWPWTACAFGPAEAACLAAAIARGGHVRVGFENNVTGPDGAPARDNAAQVATVAALAEAAGRPLATIDQARTLYIPSTAPGA